MGLGDFQLFFLGGGGHTNLAKTLRECAVLKKSQRDSSFSGEIGEK